MESATASDYLALAVFAALCFAAALSGAFFRPGPWYENLAKPSWRPPNWLFGPAWLVLFCLIATAAWRVWRVAGFEEGSLAMAIFGVQLVFNAAWSALFFGARRMDWAFWNLAALWLSILAMILAYAPHDATAAWMMVPYLCWVTFAGALNRAMWRLNPAYARE